MTEDVYQSGEILPHAGDRSAPLLVMFSFKYSWEDNNETAKEQKRYKRDTIITSPKER